ncbi:MAG TPA: RNA-binding cell elongation regulator Jag/EloR [Spirochaetota bacterium]|nr:protein jag [Spirochaetota bacterium]HOD13417.1 RNA-binding cell elongation regulator Jag/EloR [Spirochaetota bacterium]HPG49366.1 RNA-binding cell elongation regulator Jag/EloR [Spirochaetota bacterium]HPN10618.1 RNA-binding cell elongation regulator Jag/EloR [Spirochaetota bacterium]HQL80746.1 RNA-binding cell elongation regulator Jag/EloR [Spirochaetota bacterium]
MKVIEVEGRTVDDATKKAIAELGITDSSKINIEVIDEGKSGIFGFGVSRPAKIRLFYNIDTKDIADTIRDVIENVFRRMEIDCRIADVKEGESKVYIELESKNSSGLVIGRKGKTLEALQFMVNLIVNHKTGSDKKIILDIESYRAKRERALRKMSKDIAFKVIKSGKPWTLEPMNPFERRLIHLTLQNDTRVTTKSEGQGIYRKVTIMPKQ